MKAVICTRYGPPEVLQLTDVAKPTAGRDELLIKIRATAATTSDTYVRSALSTAPIAMQLLLRLALGFTKPRRPILGFVVAGEVEAIGKRVTRFRVGDRVCAFTKMRFGAYAQYSTLPENRIVTLAPANFSFDEAAAITYGGLLALHYLKKGGIQRGQRVLIYGASGAVGTSAIQLAKHFGAHVTAVCSLPNFELVRSLGADSVLDYTSQQAPPVGDRYDLVLDAVGKSKSSALKVACENALTPNGKAISVDDGVPSMTAADLALLVQLAEAGEVKPVIDRSYSLEQIADAHRYVELKHKRGNVVVTVGHEG